jgi:hypothetical protein
MAWYGDWNVLNTLITGITGLLGAGIGGFATYKAANNQIESQREMLKQEKIEQEKLAVAILENFLSFEIYVNLEKIRYLVKFFEEGYESTQNASIGLVRGLAFDEFNGIKHELLKYHSEITTELVFIYQAFKLVDSRSYLFDLSKSEFYFVESAYRKGQKLIREGTNNI